MYDNSRFVYINDEFLHLDCRKS